MSRRGPFVVVLADPDRGVLEGVVGKRTAPLCNERHHYARCNALGLCWPLLTVSRTSLLLGRSGSW